jgi:Uma2 family endonuclease
MGKAGLFASETRVELIEGEVITMAPIGSLHGGHVNRLLNLLVPKVAESAIVSVQNPLQLGDFSEPQPDLMVLRPEPSCYVKRHPTPADVLLLIEVSDSTVRYDREVKIPLYARHGVVESWLVNLEINSIEVYLKPQTLGYAEKRFWHRGETLVPSQLANVAVIISEVLG